MSTPLCPNKVLIFTKIWQNFPKFFDGTKDRAATDNFCHARRPHQRRAAVDTITFYSEKCRQGLGLGCFASRGGTEVHNFKVLWRFRHISVAFAKYLSFTTRVEPPVKSKYVCMYVSLCLTYFQPRRGANYVNLRCYSAAPLQCNAKAKDLILKIVFVLIKKKQQDLSGIIVRTKMIFQRNIVKESTFTLCFNIKGESENELQISLKIYFGH